MAVIHTPETAYAKEFVKWQAHHTAEGPPGRPYVFHEFPSAMYKAERDDMGRVSFTMLTVDDEDQMRNLQSRGFGCGKKQAYDLMVAGEREIAKLAAERAANERTMSESARREAARVDDATDRHVPVVPETPIRTVDKAAERRPKPLVGAAKKAAEKRQARLEGKTTHVSSLPGESFE